MAEPSLRFTKVRNFGGMPAGDTEYIVGRNSRREYREARGSEHGALRAFIHNRDLQYMFQLDLEARVYTATRVTEFGAPVGVKPRHMELRKSGRTRHVHTETVDTGERREMFGYTARRVITRTTETPQQSESEVDGWYIDPPAAWLRMYPPRAGHAYLSASTNGVTDEVKFTDAGARETGFPLLITRTHRAMGPTTVQREEVTEFSEDELDAALFVPPADFKRVPQLPGLFGYRYPFRMRVWLRWEMWKDRLRPGFKLASR